MSSRRHLRTTLLVLVLLPLAWAPGVLLGGEEAVPPLALLAPVLVAATRGGAAAALATALVAGLLAGPLTPRSTATGEAQPMTEWLVRAGFFAALGAGMAVMAARLRREADGRRTLALHDSLTGLPNAVLLDEHLTTAVSRARRDGSSVVLACLDLDDFKLVNDGLGHAAGDALLRTVAERLSGCVRAGDVLARQGGDDFLLMLTDVPAGEGVQLADATFARVQAALREPCTAAGAELQIAASMGVSVFPDDAEDAGALRRHADAAMYRAKASGSTWSAYDADDAMSVGRLSLAARLRRAIELDELELHYQPIFELQSGDIRGVEALVRWNDPERGMVPPNDFIPVAEQTGVIEALGDWVLVALCRQARAWADLGLTPHLGINVSPLQLRRRGFAARFAAQIAEHGLDPRRFIVELTETAWTLDAARTLPVLAELREAGLGIALDDFGAGYSNLARLLELPIDVIKVDRSLLAEVPARADAVAVLTAIQSLAEACRCDVVAEGIETAEQRTVLAGIGSRLGQGFGLARPAPAPAVTALLLDGLTETRRLSDAVSAAG